MWNKVLALSTAFALIGAAGAGAQQRFDGRGGDQSPQHLRPSAEDIGAFTDARVAGLKAGLRLTPEQDKNWPAFEQAYRNLAKLRSERRAAMHDARRPDDQNVVQDLQRHADAVSQYGAALKDLAGAAAPLFASLDDGQKRRFVTLSRILASASRQFAMGHDFGERHGERGGGYPGKH